MKDPVFVRDLILRANNFYFLFFKVKSLFKALGLTFRKTPFQFEYTEYLSQVNKYGQNYLATLKKCHSLADVKNLARGLKKKNIGDRLFSEGQSKLNDILDQSSFKLSKRLMQDFLEKYKPGVLEQLVKMHNREKFVEALLVAKRKPVNSRVKMLSLSRQLIFMHRVEAVIKHQKIGSRPLPLSLLSGCQKGGVRRAFSKVELTRQQRQLLLREVKF